MRASFIAAAVAAAAACGPAARPAPAPAEPPTTAQPAPEEPPVSEPTPAPTTVTQTAQPQELSFPDEAFRAAQPEAGPPRPFRLPHIQRFKLKHGTEVYLVEKHDLPIVSLDLVFEGGGAVDPTSKEGLASVCMAMLTEGTQKLDKIAYSEALADTASSIDSYAGDDTQGLSLNTLSKHFDATFALYVDTLRTPGFRPEDLDRMVKRRIEGLKQTKGTPAAVAPRVARPVLYGPKHPFGRVTTEASLAAITLDDCKAHHAAALKPGGARLFVVGDMTEARLRAYFDGPLLSGWTGRMPALTKVAKPATQKGRIFLVHIPGAAQSQVSLMHFGPKRGAADYFPTAMVSAVIGGGFSSRLNMNLREDKGYSYGAYGTFSYNRFQGVFTAGASVRTDATYQTVLEIAREVGTMAAGDAPATADELTREKAGAIQGLPSRFATGGAALGMFRSLAYFGLPLDYYDRYVASVEKVNAAQVAKAAKQHLKPAQAVFVVVGDGDAPVIARDGKEDKPLLKDGQPVTLRAALADLAASGKLGAGALVELDADGKAVTAAAAAPAAK